MEKTQRWVVELRKAPSPMLIIHPPGNSQMPFLKAPAFEERPCYCSVIHLDQSGEKPVLES